MEVSAPYLVHFMRGYKFNERLDNKIEQAPGEVAEVLARYQHSFLSAGVLEQWSALDPANAKLRDMVGNHLDRGLWRLLWLPPTLPYWPLEGPFKDRAQTTKSLMFSAWNVVPDVVSAILSYEAERRMVGGRIKAYQEPAKQQVPLLRFTQSAAKVRSRHRLLLLLMPCLPLADQVHPLDAPAGRDRRQWVRDRVQILLSTAELPDPQGRPVDDRWEWAAPLILDPGLRPFLQAWRDGELPAFSEDTRLPKPNPELFDSYLDDMLDLDFSQLGRRPPDLVDLLTEVALGSPTILALRCLRATRGVRDDTRRRFAALIADAFWSLFNQPAVISHDAPARDRSRRFTRRGCLLAARARLLPPRKPSRPCSTNNGICSGSSIRGPKAPMRTLSRPTARKLSSRSYIPFDPGCTPFLRRPRQ